MDGSSKPPQISEMFSKFATAFKTKTFEFFADESDDAAATEDSDGFGLLDSAEEFITNQKVVVIKPDSAFIPVPPPSSAVARPPSLPTTPPPSTVKKSPTKNPVDAQITRALISSLFATVSSLKASYLQLQAAHAPFDEEAMKAADRAVLTQLQRLSEIKQFYRHLRVSSELNLDFAIGSCLESQVQENQSLLRILETVVNRLQSEIDSKRSEALALRRNFDKVQQSSKALLKKLNGCPVNSPSGVLLSVTVFDSALRDSCRLVFRFTKLLIALMKRAGWDLDLVANSVYQDIGYAKGGHKRYALLSYVCLGMFLGFDSEGFGLGVGGSGGGGISSCDANSDSNPCKNTSLKQLVVEHVATGPMEALRAKPDCDFSKFCEKKYQQIIHPTMESSIFTNLDKNQAVLCSWRSLGVFYEAFVNMASSIWVLHKLAFSFEPAAEIFQVERGAEFSIVYMEDATRRCNMSGMARPKVGFTVVPGFKIRKTIIQSRVYLNCSKCTES